MYNSDLCDICHRYLPISSVFCLLSRGLLSGLPRASVSEDYTARHQQHQAEAPVSQVEDIKASCRDLHASTAVPALSSFLHGHLSVVHAVITVYPWPFYFLVRSKRTCGKHHDQENCHRFARSMPCTRCECPTTTTD